LMSGGGGVSADQCPVIDTEGNAFCLHIVYCRCVISPLRRFLFSAIYTRPFLLRKSVEIRGGGGNLMIFIYYMHPELEDLKLPFLVGKGSRAALERAPREHRGAVVSTGGALGHSERAKGGAAREVRFWLLGEPDVAALYSATAAPLVNPAMLPAPACCCLDSYSFAGS
jgi:hypothetical protein